MTHGYAASQTDTHGCTNVVRNRCTKHTHLSPTTVISLPSAHLIRMKIRSPQVACPPVEPRVAGSNPVAHPKTPSASCTCIY